MEKGRAINALKGTSSRKRKRHEIEEIKEEEAELKKDKLKYLQRVKRLKLNEGVASQIIEQNEHE